MSAETDLADLRHQAEAAQQRYWQTRTEIENQRARLEDARQALASLGCADLIAADVMAADLQAQLDATLTQIRHLL